MEYRESDAIQLLARTPAVLEALIRPLPGDWVTVNEGPGTWSPFDIVGHLIHGERTDWIPRARIILEHGEAQPFVPFDRFAQLQDNAGATIGELLDRFAKLRDENLAILGEMNLTPEEYARTGTHPEFGRVTLRELMATWVVHDHSHLAQVTRVLARQYGDQVGPFKAFIPILGDAKPVS